MLVEDRPERERRRVVDVETARSMNAKQLLYEERVAFGNAVQPLVVARGRNGPHPIAHRCL
jgi:hypothetical protein